MAFWQITVPASYEISEALTNFLWEQGALGVVEEEVPGTPPRLRAFFAEAASSTLLLDAVTAYLESLRVLGFPADLGHTEISTLLDEAWASAWQQSFPARPVGRRLLVLPPWLQRDVTGAPSAHDDRLAVVIEPGRAFGTGHHGTTEGCLVLLEEALAAAPGASVLDIGTGTGILAIAALRLGARCACAIDVDPDAVSAARVNAIRNGCQGLSVRLAEVGDVPDRFGVVLANLLTHTHLALAAHYARLVTPGGQLVLGGMLSHEGALVDRTLSLHGFALGSHLTLEGWASLRLSAAPR
jgi:ribosomal protein L11 methyltransferase